MRTAWTVVKFLGLFLLAGFFLHFGIFMAASFSVGEPPFGEYTGWVQVWTIFIFYYAAIKIFQAAMRL